MAIIGESKKKPLNIQRLKGLMIEWKFIEEQNNFFAH